MFAFTNNGMSFRAWNDPASLSPGEIFFDHAPSEDELNAAFPGRPAALAVQAAAAKPKPTPLDWFMRLSPATQAALDTAARTDTAVSLALRYASGVTSIDVTDQRTIDNVNLLKSKALITDAEAAALLAP